MGFLSSLFGTKRSSTPTSTVVQSTKLPEEISPFVKEILGEAQQLYKGELARGYQPYTGTTIAPLTPDQEAALTGLAGLPGTTAPFLERATEVFETGGERFTPETAEEYMSPYQRAVTDIEKREAQTNFERNIMPRFEADAIRAGGLSGLGSRAGVEAAELQRGQSQLLADIEAKGLQKAFTDARQAFELQKARERGMAGDIAGMGTRALTSGLSELGAQKAAGEERQALGQSALDEAYYRFLEEQQFPQETLAQYSGMVYGNPFARTFDQTKTTMGAQPSTGQSLMSLGLTGLGLAGGFGGGNYFSQAGKTLGKLFPSAEGGSVGGLSGLPVVRRQQGSIGNKPVNNDPNQSVLLRDLLSFWNRISDPFIAKTDAEGRAAKRRGDMANPISAFYGGPDTASAKERQRIIAEKIQYPVQTVGEREVSEGIIKDAERNLESEKVRLASDPREDIIVDETIGREELIDPKFGTPIEIGTLTDDEIVKAKLERGTQEPVSTKDSDDNIEGGFTYVNGKLVPIDPDADRYGRGVRKKGKDPSKKLDIDALSLITGSLEGIETSRNETKKLIEEWRSKVKADQQTIEGSRNKRNELNFWRSLVKMGEAVGKADPTKGFLNALAEGATAGSKEYLDKRLELLKEAEGDGQKAINALKTNIALQQADTKLLISAGQMKAQQITAMANWIKSNGLKRMNTKVMAELIKNAKERASGHPKDSQAMRDAYSDTLRMSILAYEKTGNLATAIDAGLRVSVRQVNPNQSRLATDVSKTSRGYTLKSGIK
jgi:hypothetical protein